MAADHSLALREAIVAYLRAAPQVAAIVDARVYGEQPPAVPEWPFIRYGLPTMEAYEASGWAGATHDVVLHCFAKGPGMDAVGVLNKAVVDVLDGVDVAPAGTMAVQFEWQSTQVIRDTDEAGAYHGIVSFTVTTAETV